MADKAQQVSDVDIAYQVLASQGSTLYFRELITRVLENKGKSVRYIAYAMSEVHTQINMDSRFVHMGKGMWGLAEWLPQRGGRHIEEAAAAIDEDIHVRRERLFAGIQEPQATVGKKSEESY
ncbi:MAG: DNA-directed polymerase delta subunit [Firmicutes bacterium]|nr:DNA-directed polymerase delta subunit [Bacillota bacterium]